MTKDDRVRLVKLVGVAAPVMRALVGRVGVVDGVSTVGGAPKVRVTFRTVADEYQTFWCSSGELEVTEAPVSGPMYPLLAPAAARRAMRS